MFLLKVKAFNGDKGSDSDGDWSEVQRVLIPATIKKPTGMFDFLYYHCTFFLIFVCENQYCRISVVIREFLCLGPVVCSQY